MGRVKIQMKKIENRTQRHIAFAKRKNGLIKKAYELSTLCDVQMALILFSPSGKLFHFESKERIEETIQKYVALPGYKRGSLQEEPFIRRWIDAMRLETRESGPSENFEDAIHQQPKTKIDEEIEKCNAELANVNQQLEVFLKNPNQWKTLDEVNHQERVLLATLDKVRSRMQFLEAESKHFDVQSAF